MLKMILHFIVLAVCLVGSLAIPPPENVDPRLGRIIGGDDRTDHKSIVSVYYKGHYVCAGVIIDLKYAITAAHCVFTYPHGSQINKDHFKILAGTNELKTDQDTLINVVEVTVHEDYKQEDSEADPMLYDIALLKVDNFGQDASKFSTIKIIKADRVNDDDSLIVVGWGSKKAGAEFENILRKVPTKLITTAECQKIYGTRIDNKGKQICTLAGTIAKPSGICYGDSGGPLIKTDISTSEKSLLGIVSWGTPCARGKPDVFSSVLCGGYYNWINEKCQYCLTSS